MPHPPTDPRLDALAATAAVLWDALDQVDAALVDAALNNLTAALDREAAAAEPDEYDQSTWPACEHCGRVQVHRSDCPAVAPAVAPHQPPLDDRALGTAADDRYGEILDRLGAIANAEQSELLVELDEVVGKRLSEHEDAAAAAERAGTWGWT